MRADDHSPLLRLARRIDALNDWCGRAIAWLALAMVLLTAVVVVLRYFFDTGWIWMQESVTWMHALVFLLGAGYTFGRDEHVRVDIFYRAMTERRKALINLLGALLLLLPTCALIVWSSWDYVAASWATREASREAGGLPGIYLLKTALPVMALLLALQGLASALQAWVILRARRQR